MKNKCVSGNGSEKIKVGRHTNKFNYFFFLEKNKNFKCIKLYFFQKT